MVDTQGQVGALIGSDSQILIHFIVMSGGFHLVPRETVSRQLSLLQPGGDLYLPPPLASLSLSWDTDTDYSRGAEKGAQVCVVLSTRIALLESLGSGTSLPLQVLMSWLSYPCPIAFPVKPPDGLMGDWSISTPASSSAHSQPDFLVSRSIVLRR